MAKMFLFPVLTEAPKDLSGIAIVLAENGLFEFRSLPGGGFVSRKIDGVKGLSPQKEEIKFLEKKIPFVFYQKIIEFFRAIHKKFNEGNEAYIEIGYNPIMKDYFLYVPTQQVSGAHVKYNKQEFYTDNPGCYIVANFHSHSTFGAFFSGTDNGDDTRDMFAGVIGHVDSLIPDVKVRFTAGDKQFDLRLDDMFCNSDLEIDVDMEAMTAKVTKYVSPAIITHADYDGDKFKAYRDYLDQFAGYDTQTESEFKRDRYMGTFQKESLFDILRQKGKRK